MSLLKLLLYMHVFTLMVSFRLYPFHDKENRPNGQVDFMRLLLKMNAEKLKFLLSTLISSLTVVHHYYYYYTSVFFQQIDYLVEKEKL